MLSICLIPLLMPSGVIFTVVFTPHLIFLAGAYPALGLQSRSEPLILRIISNTPQLLALSTFLSFTGTSIGHMFHIECASVFMLVVATVLPSRKLQKELIRLRISRHNMSGKRVDATTADIRSSGENTTSITLFL